eukprot:991006_1
MGGRESTLNVCEYCGYSQSANFRQSCPRCHGCVASSMPESFASFAAVPDENVLKNVHVLPFEEDFTDEKDAISHEMLLNKYVMPYFIEEMPCQYIERGFEFSTSRKSFKVVACFPPKGIVTNKTRVHTLKFGGSERFVTRAHDIHQLSVVPSKASLRDGQPSPNMSLGAFLEDKTVNSGDIFFHGGVEYNVVSCIPPYGRVTGETVVTIDMSGPPLVDMVRLHMLPIFETLPNNEKAIGDRPGITEAQIVQRYCQPFFRGRNRILSQGQEVDIDGVSFFIRACEPSRGIITCQTQLYANGEPLRQEEIRARQLADDEKFARQLQEYENIFSELVGGFTSSKRRLVGLSIWWDVISNGEHHRRILALKKKKKKKK